LSDIRLRYAGLSIFALRILSVVTGVLFVMIVTRRLDVADFGLWQVISVTVGYAIFPAAIVTYWVTRDIARGKPVARTALVMSGILSIGGVALYLAISKGISASLDPNFFVFFLVATLQVPIYYLVRTLEATAHGFRPEVAAYGFLVLEVAKIIFAFILLADMRLGLNGAILSVALAQVVQIAALVLLIRKKLRGSTDTKKIKKWLSLAWLPSFSGLAGGGGLLFTLDAVLVALIVGSTLPVAIYQIAAAVGKIVGYSGLLASALYPKLLAGGGRLDTEASMKYVLMFGIPMAVGSMILAPELLFVFRSDYVVGASVLRVLSLGFLLIALTTIFDNIIIGTEKVDISENTRFRDYRKSKLFLLPSIYYLQAISYLSILTVVSIYARTFSVAPADLALYWSLAFVGTMTPFSLYRWNLARKIMPFSIPWKRASRYAFSSLIMAVVVIQAKGYVTFQERIFDYVVLLYPVLLLGAFSYGFILFLIDGEFRSFIIRTLKSLQPTRLEV